MPILLINIWELSQFCNELWKRDNLFRSPPTAAFTNSNGTLLYVFYILHGKYQIDAAGPFAILKGSVAELNGHQFAGLWFGHASHKLPKFTKISFSLGPHLKPKLCLSDNLIFALDLLVLKLRCRALLFLFWQCLLFLKIRPSPGFFKCILLITFFIANYLTI